MPTGLGIAAVGGSLISGIVGAGAAKSAAGQQSDAAVRAAQIQADAANNAANMQLGMFNTIRGDLSPYRDVGTSALPSYLALLGLGGGSSSAAPATGASAFTGGAAAGQPDWNAYYQANPDVQQGYQSYTQSPAYTQGNSIYGAGLTPTQYAQAHYTNYGQAEGRQLPDTPAASTASGGSPASVYDPASMQAALEATPGYQFTRDQGEKAVTSSLSARGLGGGSGAFGKGLARFVTGLADQTYQQQVGNYQNAVGIGQSAANQTGAFGQGATTNATNALIGGANASAAGVTGAANAGAAGTVGAANALTSGINGATNGYLTSKILGMYGNGAGSGGADMGALASQYPAPY